MTTTLLPHTAIIHLPTDDPTPPRRPARLISVLRRVGSILARAMQTLSVRDETPSQQATRGVSSIDRPVR